MAIHTDCETKCQAIADGLPMCGRGCRKLRIEAADLAEGAAEVDTQPRAVMPALCFVSAQCIAEEAARRGLAECEAKRHERALGVVTEAASILIGSESDESPGGWARRGARDGIIAAWRNVSFIAPDALPTDLELYMAAYSLTRSATMRIVANTRRGVVA